MSKWGEMDRFGRSSLDNYITGHYGEDQFKGEFECPDCQRLFYHLVEFEEHECPYTPDPSVEYWGTGLGDRDP